MSEENTGTPAPEAVEVVEQGDVTPEVESSEEVTEQAAETKEKQEEIKKVLKSYEVKVNGKSKVIDIDLDNDEEVKKYIQKAMASDERFQEGAGYKKQAEQLIERLQNDPLSILRNKALGLDIRKLAEQVLLEDLEEQQKSPEQKKLEEYERKLKDFEDKKAKEDEERKTAQQRESEARMTKEIEDQMLKALDKSDFPAEPYFVRRVADYMDAAIQNGWEDITVEQAVELAERRMREDFSGLIGKHKDPAKLEKLLGKDVLNNYRKANIAKVKTAPTSAAKSTAKVEPTDAPVVPKKIRIDSIGGW